ncbi:MAG: hypothetical protein HQL13_05240 [Candidatus Omnitrophica bacterium]|nr:hypothetical protein [Candidatus Omnitrophota bacterium]
MSENFIFKAIFISLAVHTAVLYAAYVMRVNDPQFKAMRQARVEISYKPAYKKPVDVREYPIRMAHKLDLSNTEKLLKDGESSIGMTKERQMLPFGLMYERKPENMRTMELTRKVSITPIKSEKIDNPVYAAYQEMVRERIKERVYANYDKMDDGSVHLAFLVDQYGVLKVARIVPEKTNAPEHLQEITLKSLREASPFPPFLKGMNLTDFPFNIEIQYQIGD